MRQVSHDCQPVCGREFQTPSIDGAPGGISNRFRLDEQTKGNHNRAENVWSHSRVEKLPRKFGGKFGGSSTALDGFSRLPSLVRLVSSAFLQAREVYRPVAAEASLMYFMLLKLSTVDSMYQYSLDSFTR